MLKIRALLLIVLLSTLLPALALAAERTATVAVDDIDVVMPLPDGYLQASVDVPEWLAYVRSATPPAFPRPVEALIVAACLEGASPNVYCRTAYDLQVSPKRVTPETWPVMRNLLSRAMAEQSQAVLDAAMAERNAHMREVERPVDATLDTRASVILLAPEDTRGVRYRLRSPGVLKDEGGEVRQWRFGAQVVLHGRPFSVIVTRELAPGEDAEAVAKAMEVELDAFLQRLYALNPMYATP